MSEWIFADDDRSGTAGKEQSAFEDEKTPRLRSFL
jgi:hypothetical protein